MPAAPETKSDLRFKSNCIGRGDRKKFRSHWNGAVNPFAPGMSTRNVTAWCGQDSWQFQQ
jgi:hypothetical protein